MILPALNLVLDRADHASIMRAIAEREHAGVLPKGDGDLNGRILAEICRGWMDYRRHSQESSDDTD